MNTGCFFISTLTESRVMLMCSILDWAAIAETSRLRRGLRSDRICAYQHPPMITKDTSI